MDVVAWRFRIMIGTVVALMIFGDLYSGVRSDHTTHEGGIQSHHHHAATATASASSSAPSPSNAGKFQQQQDATDIEISEDPDINELSAAVALKQKRDSVKTQLTDAIKESCLPKMLCEMASKPEYMLSEKEKDLLQLIRSSTMSLAMNGAPSKWHFAAHMGELLRYTGDNMSGPMGCANLWPNCPISSKKLMKLSHKVKI